MALANGGGQGTWGRAMQLLTLCPTNPTTGVPHKTPPHPKPIHKPRRPASARAMPDPQERQCVTDMPLASGRETSSQ